MELKRKIIAARVITFIMAAVFIVMGVIGKKELLYTIGISMGVISVIETIRFIRLFKNKEKFEEYKNSYYDERNIFLAQKSYSFAFWVSVVAEFIALAVLAYLGRNSASALFGYVICAQMLIYLAARAVFSRKY